MTAEKVFPLFSTPIYKNKINVNVKFLNYIKQLEYHKMVSSGVISNTNYVLELAQLLDLKQLITQEINIFLKNYLCFKNINFKILTSWVIKHAKGDYSHLHMHTNSLFSGVLYLQVNKNSGDIIFVDKKQSPLYPSEIFLEVEENNLYNARFFQITPQNNEIIIFPSYLHHEVTPNKTNEDRYVLSFNIFPSGILNNNGLSELKLL